MTTATNLHQQLTSRDDSVLVVIDVQQSFIDKLPTEISGPLTNRIRWTVEMATTMDIPVVVTAEDIDNVGLTAAGVCEALPSGVTQHNKMTFGLCADETILADIRSTERKTAVLVGFETDVCVMQSALGLLAEGFRVVVLADATGSPDGGHEAGILRMRDAGGIISTVKGTFYEWVRSLHYANEHLDPAIWNERPAGISL